MTPEALFDPTLIYEYNKKGGMADLCHKSV
jgi:hypothetical protein